MIKDVPSHLDPREIVKGFTFLGETPEFDMVKTRQMMFLKFRNPAAANKAVQSRITLGSIVLQCEEKVKRNLVPDHPRQYYTQPNQNVASNRSAQPNASSSSSSTTTAAASSTNSGQQQQHQQQRQREASGKKK